tara:strand:- start:1287 stop:1628 length:342 start_codon:yes stop_codon:yes gene_type:complete
MKSEESLTDRIAKLEKRIEENTRERIREAAHLSKVYEMIGYLVTGPLEEFVDPIDVREASNVCPSYGNWPSKEKEQGHEFRNRNRGDITKSRGASWLIELLVECGVRLPPEEE